MAAPIKNNPFSADYHLLYFAEFTRAVELAGGTTPHMLMTVESAKRQKDFQEKLWWAGCYAFVYNYATAEIIYNNWRPGGWKSEDALVSWARANWKGIKFRKERKAARSPERLASCMHTYWKYMQTVQDRPWFCAERMHGPDRYNAAFGDICNEVKYMGRYIAIRWIEVIRRVFEIDMEMPDLRARDGDHPRKALALMYPEYHDILMGGNSDPEIAITNDVVEICKGDLHELYNVNTDYYTMQSLLCEYKQSCLGRKQYPGKSIDTELVYFSKIYDEWWGDKEKKYSIMFDVRKTIFPKCTLGEIQGWSGVRNELGEVLAKYGYTWSDYVYNYVQTKDLADPVYWPGMESIL